MLLKLDEFQQLKLIAWNIKRQEFLEEEEAFALYECNWRFIDQSLMDEKERALLERLKKQFGNGVLNV